MTNVKIGGKTEVQAVTKHLLKKGMTTKEIHEDMVQIYADDFLSYASVKFKQSRDSTEDDLQSGHPKTSITAKQVDTIYHKILDDRCITVAAQQRAQLISISSTLF